MDDVTFSYNGPRGGVTIPQHSRCNVVHGLTPLLRDTARVLSQTGAKSRRVLSARVGVCDAAPLLGCLTLTLTLSDVRPWTRRFRVWDGVQQRAGGRRIVPLAALPRPVSGRRHVSLPVGRRHVSLPVTCHFRCRRHVSLPVTCHFRFRGVDSERVQLVFDDLDLSYTLGDASDAYL